jgi:hypothetical protein
MGKPKIIYKDKSRSFVNFMARESFNASIKNHKDKKLNFDFNFNNDIIRLKVDIKYLDSVNGMIHDGFDISGSSSDEDMHMCISLHKEYFTKRAYNLYNAELREFLRHELEHIGQYLEVPGKAEIYGLEPSNNIIEYLTQPYEVDAFLYGLNYKRKYLKTDILDEIDILLRDYYKVTDIWPVKKIWIERLKIILPHTIHQ